MRISDWSSDVCSSDLLVTTWPDGSTTRYGSPTPGRASVAITIASPTAARRIATNPMLAAGEEFMSGGLRVPDDDLLPLLDLVSHNMRWEWGNRARMLLPRPEARRVGNECVRPGSSRWLPYNDQS